LQELGGILVVSSQSFNYRAHSPDDISTFSIASCCDCAADHTLRNHCLPSSLAYSHRRRHTTLLYSQLSLTRARQASSRARQSPHQAEPDRPV